MRLYEIVLKNKLKAVKNIPDNAFELIKQYDLLLPQSNFMFLCYIVNSFLTYFIYKLFRMHFCVPHKSIKYNILLTNKIIEFNNVNQRLYNKALANSLRLQKIIIKNTLVIPHYAFSSCYNLKHVYIDKHVKIIKQLAFANCIQLEEIYIPHTVECIESNAFINCFNLKKVIFY